MKDTKIIAMGGICTALSSVSLYFASFVPGAELSLYALASVFVCVMCDEAGIKGGFMVYAASSLLGFILMPGKLGVVPFIFFFGIYPMIKFCAERLKNRAVQFAIKIALFLGVFLIAYFFFKDLFFKNITLPDMSVILLAIGGTAMFLVYDFILTMIVKMYRRRINRKKDDFKLS